MTLITVTIVNGVPMGREMILGYPNHIKAYEAPGMTEGEWEACLQWQYKHPFDKEWNNEPIVEPYFDEDKEHEISVHQGSDTRQIWVLSQKEVEGKEGIRKVQKVVLTEGKYAEIIYPSNITVQDIEIIQKGIEMIELATQ